MAKIHEVASKYVYWRETIEGMRKTSLKLMEDGRNIERHLNRMFREYGDWEDRLKALDDHVEKLSAETGLTVNEIHEEIAIPQTLKTSSALDDLFDELDEPATKHEPLNPLKEFSKVGKQDSKLESLLDDLMDL